MGLVHLLYAASTVVFLAEAHRKPYKYEAARVQRRQGGPMIPVSSVASTSTLPSGVLTYVTPSPDASPVAVTQQSQIVTSYVPQFTLCELPPLEFSSISQAPISARPSGAPYQNYTISTPPGNGSCTTIYSPTETMVCATTLTALVTTYPVTNCAQDITFSSQYGYTLSTPTAVASPPPYAYGNISRRQVANVSSLNYIVPQPTYHTAIAPGSVHTGIATAPVPTAIGTAPVYSFGAPAPAITPGPSIETLTTYYVAPWQELTAGTAPADVTKVVCEKFSNGTECITGYQVWQTILVNSTATTTISLNISTTINGPSAVVIAETFVANITELVTTFSMSTMLESEYHTQWTSTSTIDASTSTAPTVFETLTVQEVSSTPSPTSTPTVHLTITTHMGTTTITASPSALATAA